MLEVPQNVREAENTIKNAVEQQDEAKAKAAFDKRKEAMKAWDARKNFYRWLNILLVPLLFASFGLLRGMMRRAKRAGLRVMAAVEQGAPRTSEGKS